MRIGPGFFGSLLTGSTGWSLSFDGACALFSSSSRAPVRIALDDITMVALKPGAIWAAVSITGPLQKIACDGVINAEAERFAGALRIAVARALFGAVERHQPAILKLTSGATRLMNQPAYLAHRDIEDWKTALDAGDSSAMESCMALVGNPMFPKDEAGADARRHIDALSDMLSGPRTRVRERNDGFVTKEIVRYKAFFDTVEKTPLTQEQRVACVVMEDRNLLVAAAGSGKTSTVVGKIGYALLSGQYAPKDFLVLAFNNDAARELDERINGQLRAFLPAGERIRARTFHALGLDIIARAGGRKPSVANFAGGNASAASGFMEQLIGQQMSADEAFAADWVTFRAVCLKSARDPFEFMTLDEWNEYVRANGDYRHGRRGFLTMNGEIVKSQGELALANWFYMQGVEYEYERPYEHDTATVEYRQYRPDFYLPAIGAYLEHYALDRHGKPPAIFGARYRDAMRWKAQLHADRATALITTTFADFVSGALFPKLKAELLQRGQRFSRRPVEEVLARLNSFQKTDYGALLRTFLKHAKSNEVDQETLRVRVAASRQPYRAGLFVRLFWKLKAAYDALLGKQGEIDFEDMIIKAVHDVAEHRYRHSYKLILVDEFQDISQARGKLLKALLAQAPDCKLFAVGDDWQSIYRFAGSDIDVFTRFPDHFGMTATNYLTETFRSNQGISDVASRFVSRNPGQMAKQVHAQDKTSRDVVIIRRYSDLEGLEAECEACLAEIAGGMPASSGLTTVFVLARYRHQKPGAFDKWQARFKTSLEISFRTIHSAKGLQADHVIVLGMTAGSYAFPSEISDDPLLQLVMPQAESFPNAEERRLLYVAMTRARHRVYLLGGKNAPSAFLAELIGDEAIRPMLRQVQPTTAAMAGNNAASPRAKACPRCGKGHLKVHKGEYGEFIGCSTFPRCRYKTSVRKASDRMATYCPGRKDER